MLTRLLTILILIFLCCVGQAYAESKKVAKVSPVGFSGLVWVHSDNCGPCNVMRPAIDKLAMEGKPVVIVKANTKQDQGKYQVVATPTTIAYNNSEEVDRVVGIIKEKQLRELLIKTKQAKQEKK